MKKLFLIFILMSGTLPLFAESKHILTDLHYNEAPPTSVDSTQEETILEFLATIERVQNNALDRIIGIGEQTTLVQLFSIRVSLRGAQKERENVLKQYKNERKNIKKPSKKLLDYEKNSLVKIKALDNQVKEKIKVVDMLITARNLALNSNYSVEESIKAMKWIEQERVKFYDKVYLHLKKKSSPLLSYYEDVFFETYEQVVDAYKRFKKLLVENDAYLKEQIARMNKEIIEKFGKNKRLHAILKERLQDTIIKIAQLKSSLQTKADLMKKRSKHPEWEEK